MRGIRKYAGLVAAVSALFVATAVLADGADKLGIGGGADPVRAAWHKPAAQ